MVVSSDRRTPPPTVPLCSTFCRDLQLILIRYPRMFGMAVEDIDEVSYMAHAAIQQVLAATQPVH